ncbi:CPBP family intramembrane metalloprotease [bacterium]|nr:CPBP family intramembrane metalloprotease [bacterium]
MKGIIVKQHAVVKGYIKSVLLLLFFYIVALLGIGYITVYFSNVRFFGLYICDFINVCIAIGFGTVLCTLLPKFLKENIKFTGKALTMSILIILLFFVTILTGIMFFTKAGICIVDYQNIFLIILALPILEELLFRKVMISLVRTKTRSKVLALLLPSIIFGIIHLKTSFVSAVIFGVIASAFFIAYSNISLCILLHISVNTVSFLYNGNVFIRVKDDINGFNELILIVLFFLAFLLVIVVSIILLLNFHRNRNVDIIKNSSQFYI